MSQFAFPGATQTIKRVCRKCFIFGVFSPSSALAEREGLSGNARNASRINNLAAPLSCRLYQGNVPVSSSAALNGLPASHVRDSVFDAIKTTQA